MGAPAAADAASSLCSICSSNQKEIASSTAPHVMAMSATLKIGKSQKPRIANSPTMLPRKNTVSTMYVIGLPTLRQKPTNGWITYHHAIAGGRLIMSEPCNDNPLIRFARWSLYKKSQHFDAGDQGFTKKGIVSLCAQDGFRVTLVKRYGVLAYVFAGFPDHLGVLRYLPGSALLTRLFLAIDRVICAIPGLSLLGFHVVVVAEPAE